ncbi:MAG TPA: class I SAM-dependent methyltransferase [Gemmatimonadaceae bacterium]|nr:class I SAM-dependent methyltransferase [Gemmatimonadaceae bacterium]
MQDVRAERAFYETLFTEKPDNEHITFGYDELYALAFPTAPNGLLLDLGCGTGAHSIRLARRGYSVVSVDLTHQGAHSAKKRLEAEGYRPMAVVADAENLPFRDGAVDTVWAALLLHHFPVLDRLPKEIRRVAKRRIVTFEPNSGNFLTWFAFNVINQIWGLSTTTKNQRSLNPRRLQKVLAPLGFRRFAVHFVDRGWSDAAGSIVRRMYRGVTRFLPDRFRANKFLLTAEL